MSNELTSGAKHKLQLYTAATYLFDMLLSHPQVVELLSEYEPDLQLLVPIVDKAMKEFWDQLYQEAKRLYAENHTYDEVLQVISSQEPDLEIATWIC